MLFKSCLAIGLFLLSRPGFAAPQSFDFRDPKATNTISITIDSAWEPITGSAAGISGTVFFDPKNPALTTGKIEVAVSSIEFPNKGYGFTARASYGLYAEKYPAITFALKKVRTVKEIRPGHYRAVVEADFTCRGITRPLIVPVLAAYLPGKAGPRGGGVEGDLLTLRTNFVVHRNDYKIAQGVEEELVAQDVEVRVAVVGIHQTKSVKPALAPKPKPKSSSQKGPTIKANRLAGMAKKSQKPDAAAPGFTVLLPKPWKRRNVGEVERNFWAFLPRYSTDCRRDVSSAARF